MICDAFGQRPSLPSRNLFAVTGLSAIYVCKPTSTLVRCRLTWGPVDPDLLMILTERSNIRVVSSTIYSEVAHRCQSAKESQFYSGRSRGVVLRNAWHI